MDAREALAVVAAGKTLTRAEAEATMGSVMAGEAHRPARLLLAGSTRAKLREMSDSQAWCYVLRVVGSRPSMSSTGAIV